MCDELSACLSGENSACFLFGSEQDPSGRYRYSEVGQQAGQFHTVMDESPKSMELWRVFGVLLLMLGCGSSYRVGWGLVHQTGNRNGNCLRLNLYQVKI